MASTSEVYSRHILFFPFQWQPLESNYRDGRVALKTILKAVWAAGHWKDKVYNRQDDYSAYNYLHDFAHGAVFQHKTPENSSVFNFRFARSLPYFLRVDNKSLPKGLPRRFPDDADASSTLFQLDFFMARLNVYETGVAVLSLFIDNKLHTSPEEVLVINDLSRRLFPPHLNYNTGILKPMEEGMLPVSVRLGDWEERWDTYPRDNKKDGIPDHYLPRFILELLGPKFDVDKRRLSSDGILIQQALDDRMFFMCMLVDETLGRDLGGYPAVPSKKPGKSAAKEAPPQMPYLESAFWYAFIFADHDKPQIANRAMMRELLQQATYARWTDAGTLYGASRYSFVAIGPAWLKAPMTNNYFRLTELCLAQRASALRFREEASGIAARIARPSGTQRMAQQIQNLYGDYIRFVNRFHFSEATPVEQGIELYDLLRRQLRVHEQVESLKSELEEMHSYAAMLREAERSRALNFLTVLGAAFLLPSFLLAYFSLSEDWKRPLLDHPWTTTGVLAFSGVLAGLLYYLRTLRRTGRTRVVEILVVLLFLCLIGLLPHFPKWFW